MASAFFAKKISSCHRSETSCGNNIGSTCSSSRQHLWNNSDAECEQATKRTSSVLRPLFHNICYMSVLVAFTLGLLIGVFIPIVYLTNLHNSTTIKTGGFGSSKLYVNNTKHYNSQLLKRIFLNNSYSNPHVRMNDIEKSDGVFSTVKFIGSEPGVEQATSARLDSVDVTAAAADGIVENGIFWGTQVERSLPAGYAKPVNDQWNRFVKNSIAVRLELGCGRMQNRLLTFMDGSQACVRYRQNTDQIQGELFSYYLAQILKLPNLAPSTIRIVDLADPVWQNIRPEISSAQWSANRPVVLTKYIADLDAAYIPAIFKPSDRHLNKLDVLNMTAAYTLRTIPPDSRAMHELIELAQWSDLIIFDYLTANLDRIVNNLYNYQWNVNIMDAPAHNLAQKVDSRLLLFLDNESGLLHGYRLLKKYEIYHSVLLDNLCVFRRSTANAIRALSAEKNIGRLLREMFERENSEKIKDILPTLPDKSVKVLNERIDRVQRQIAKCESVYGDTNSPWS